MKKCLLCGKDHEIDGEHCQECIDKGLVAVKGIVADSVKTIGDTVKTIDESQKSITERLDALESAPIQRAFNINKTVGSKYLGYDLGNQNVALREKASKNPLRFASFANDEKAEEYARFMIDVTRALRGDIKAQMKLQTKASELVEGTDSLGGYTVPEEFQASLIELAKEQSFSLQ